MRLFVGIPLAEGTTRELTALCVKLCPSAPTLRWSKPESWHITLQFLGNTGTDQLNCLAARLAEIRSATVPIRIGALDIFDRAGVFIVEVDLTPGLIALQKQVVAATADCGFAAEDRPYHPHITLARAKDTTARRDLKKLKAPAQPAFSSFRANEFLLYESHTDPGGSRYEAKARFALSEQPEQTGR
jgi:RNA 2',3'-cyclic 3'-phosphodiesterase